MQVIGIIPARMGSSRFPNKPLAPIFGRPMLEHVWYRVAASPRLTGVYVATCDDEIRRVVEGFGGRAAMTSPDHERGTDRIAEAAATLGLADTDVVVNIQGDEPMLLPRMIDEAVRPFLFDPATEATNLCAPLSDGEVGDPNEIKVVTDLRGRALFMSRAPIPTDTRRRGDAVRRKQVCVIGFRASVLARFARLAQTPLEQAESIDMMRLIENGVGVTMIPTAETTYAVDTPEGLRRVEQAMRADPRQYRFVQAMSDGKPPSTFHDDA
jgi:3-deoxy-manno-octulosonate cytidylyltransferase (CMP-KDO synthetase)